MQELDFNAIVPNKVDSAVVLMHGFSTNKDDLVDLALTFKHSLPNTAFYCPNAPIPVENVPNGWQWFPIVDDLERAQNATLQDFDDICFSMMSKARQVIPLIDKFLEIIAEKHHLNRESIVIGGFSQGAQIAVQAGLTLTPSIAGIIAFSGIIGQLPTDEVKSLPPILMTHGTNDEVIPFEAHKATVAALNFLGARVTDVILSNAGHTINETAISSATNFLNKVLSKSQLKH